MSATNPPSDDTPIGDVPNLGPASVRMLSAVDIRTAGDLRRLGPDLVFRMLRESRIDVSVNMLYAMAAGIQGRHWLDLTRNEREELKREIED
ncbi:MAG: TfoX/Sxy family protein [Rhodothermales bacterium]|nr:TfoX/Sxy family protein [Rhodothermales bacterium]